MHQFHQPSSAGSINLPGLKDLAKSDSVMAKFLLPEKHDNNSIEIKLDKVKLETSFGTFDWLINLLIMMHFEIYSMLSKGVNLISFKLTSSESPSMKETETLCFPARLNLSSPISKY